MAENLRSSQSAPDLLVEWTNFQKGFDEIGSGEKSVAENFCVHQTTKWLENGSLIIEKDFSTTTTRPREKLKPHQMTLKPVFLGAGLIGISLSSFLFLLPNLFCGSSHLLLATIFTTSAFSAPFVTSIFLDSRRLCLVILFSFACVIAIFAFSFVPYLHLLCFPLLGPIIVGLDSGSLNLVFSVHSEQFKDQNMSQVFIRKYLTASRGWGNVLAGLIFGVLTQIPKNGDAKLNQLSNPRNSTTKTTSSKILRESSDEKHISLFDREMLSRNTSLINLVDKIDSVSIGKRQSSIESVFNCKTSLMENGIDGMTLLLIMGIIFSAASLMYLMVLFLLPRQREANGLCRKSNYCSDHRYNLRKMLDFYLTEQRIHLVTPIVFFSGLQEAFMARDFMHVMVFQLFGLKFVCTLIILMGVARFIATWVASQAGLVGPNYLVLVFTLIFQSGLFSVLLLWIPSKDDPGMFFAITFIWGCTSASWDFIILSRASLFYTNEWKSAYSVMSFYKYLGMAMMFSIDSNLPSVDQRIYLATVFLAMAVIPLIMSEKKFNNFSKINNKFGLLEA